MRTLCSALGVACLLFAVAGTARADDRAEAREHFQKGTKFFDLGHYDEAVKEYEAAYELKDEPVLLYNIAQAHRLAGHAKDALRFYRSYLRRSPHAVNREEVENKIDELEKLVAQQEKTETLPPDQPLTPGEHVAKPKPAEPKPTMATSTPPPPSQPPPPAEPPPVVTTPPPATMTPPPAETPPSSPPQEAAAPTEQPKPASPGFFGGPGKTKKIVGIALLAVGVAGLAVGGAMSALAVGAGNDVTAEANAGQPFQPSKESAGKTDEVVAGVMYGVGGLAVVGGAVMMYLGVRDDQKASTHAMLMPVVSPTQAGAALRVRF